MSATDSLVIPDDLGEFLSQEGDLTLRWGRPYPVELEAARFFTRDELSLRNFRLNTWEYYHNYAEPGEDPDHWYTIGGVDLIKEVRSYDPTGILIWFPQFAEYGTWDCDHHIIIMLPGVSWSGILNEPGKYVNAQWYPERVKHYLLRPWADKRCADIIPEREKK